MEHCIIIENNKLVYSLLEDKITGTGKHTFLSSFALPVTELVVVSTLLLSFAFYGRNNFLEGNPRQDFVKLLFFSCVFGGALIVEARLHALLRKRRVLIFDEKSCSPERWRARLYIVGYVILVLSVILSVVTMSL